MATKASNEKGDTAIQTVYSRLTKVAPRSKYHCHISAATLMEFEFAGDKAVTKTIRAEINDDAFRSFYLLYVSPNEKCSVEGRSGNPEADACLFAIGSDGMKHEIIVQNGDLLTIIASPGHIYCIRGENEDLAKAENFNLTLDLDQSTIVNPLPGRQYNFTVNSDVNESEKSHTKCSYIHVNCFHI